MEKVSKLNLLAEEVLTQLEFNETQLLNWGFLGGYFDAEQEIQKIFDNPPTLKISNLLDENHFSVSDIIKNLTERKLIFSSRIGSRTRYAEMVRLLFLLKQRFSEKDWLNAPNLVSHIKLLPRYRAYPNRDQDWVLTKSILQDELKYAPSISLEIIEELLTGEKGYLNLAQFQIDSMRNILGKWNARRNSGTIINAGTGSGKTKAFYLPAFGLISASIERDRRNWVRLIGLYPRVELLKDQFKEALNEVKKINPFLKRRGIRPILIGGYYGDTPKKAKDVMNSTYNKWNKKGMGYICPFLTCPTCDSPLIWKEDNVQKEIKHGDGKHEKLHCSDEKCSFHVESDTIVLTRSRMEKTQPDLLFTTTEMLNRKLSSNKKEQKVFGINSLQPPLFVLLDEVHIYEGISGAHVSYLLRRWAYLSQLTSRYSGIQFVGLSATLPNSTSFFSSLTGVEESNIVNITPSEKDMTEEGMEYNLVLRGDPFSSTALLSSTVQTCMLLARMLDPLNKNVSNSAWGSKLFGFTDKLDVINRWFHIEKDAEGKKVLSRLRYPAQGVSQDELQMQRTLGQIWEVANKIDPHCLRNPLTIDITSSQNRGVNAKAKLVIATSTLEVGYNDVQVGAVIQHKAPRSLASFLQRKGRAGRVRGMRPWTIVVTSAYGRDRYIYEYPEQLFSPTLPDLSLPLRNPYIQRIQAAFALMEWFGLKLINERVESSIWDFLSNKARKDYYIKNLLIKSIKEILTGDSEELKAYLSSSLNVEEAIIDRIFWTPPRSIMFDLLPTLLVQLESDGNSKFFSEGPLPGYLPKNLFTSLEINELTISTPTDNYFIGIQQGLSEFAPGNVSKRYVNIQDTRQAFWNPLPENNNLIELENNEKIISYELTTIKYENQDFKIFQPQMIRIEQIPDKVLTDRTTSRLQWISNFELNPDDEISEQGESILLNSKSNLIKLFNNIKVFSSNNLDFVRVTRFAHELVVDKHYPKRSSEREDFCFTYGGQKAAIGFQIDSDSLVFEMKKIEWENLKSHLEFQELLQDFRPKYYFEKLKTDKFLSKILSIFEIEWLWQISLSSIMAIAISGSCSIVDAVKKYNDKIEDISKRTLEVIFQSTVVGVNEVDENEDNRLYKRLLSYISSRDIIDSLIKNLKVLTVDITKEYSFWNWVEKRAKVTILAALQTSLERLLPDLNVDELLFDLEGDKIWISEPNSGGIGMISSVSSAIKFYLGQFEELFLDSLQHCRRNEIAEGLNSVLPFLIGGELSNLLDRIRESNTLNEKKDLLEQLQNQLMRMGISPRRDFIISFNSKFIQTSINKEMDLLLKSLHEYWHKEEKRLGSRIDPRVFAVACIKREDFFQQIDTILSKIQPGIVIDEKQRFQMVENMLWSNCSDSCPECLQVYNPYQAFEEPSRHLIRLLFKWNEKTIKYNDPDWEQKVINTLEKGMSSNVIVEQTMLNQFKQKMYKILLTPIEFEYEFFYPYISAARNKGYYWIISLRIREVSNV